MMMATWKVCLSLNQTTLKASDFQVFTNQENYIYPILNFHKSDKKLALNVPDFRKQTHLVGSI